MSCAHASLPCSLACIRDLATKRTKAAESQDFWRNQVNRSNKIAFAAEQIMRERGLLREFRELAEYTKSLPKPREPRERKEHKEQKERKE